MTSEEWETYQFDEVYEHNDREYTLASGRRFFRLRLSRAQLTGAPHRYRVDLEERVDDGPQNPSWVTIMDRPRTSDQAKDENEALRSGLRDLEVYIARG